MKINRVTFTGADDKIKPEDLWVLQIKYPFVEWGILFSNTYEGKPKFPTKEWREKLKLFPALNLSAHFVGWYAKAILEVNDFKVIEQNASNFQRIQLNYNFKNSKGYDLLKVREFLKTTDKQFIFQMNKSNQSVLSNFIDSLAPEPKSTNFLYDSSGGRGKITILNNIPPIPYYYTGYSGGLGPDNIENVCQVLTNFEYPDEIWLDMESAVRTNNEFDLQKVEKVLTVVSKL